VSFILAHSFGRSPNLDVIPPETQLSNDEPIGIIGG